MNRFNEGLNAKRRITIQVGCLLLLLVSHFYLSYDFNGAWWHSAAGSCAMVFFGYLIWGREFITVSGLKISVRTFLLTLGAAVSVTALSVLVMTYVGREHKVFIVLSDFRNYIHNAFYIVNEEIIMGALMLYLLTGRLKMKPLVASVVLALVLALAHWVLYKWYFRDKGFLDLETVLTLFFAVFVKNNLILRYRHIGFAWALHFGWMAVMYGSEHYHLDAGSRLTDLEKFNLYLGSSGVLLGAILLAACSLLFWRRSVQPGLKP